VRAVGTLWSLDLGQERPTIARDVLTTPTAALTRAGRTLQLLSSTRKLPIRVAWFWLRAHRHARISGDEFSLASATRPGELAELLKLAEDRTAVVELGTGTGWTAVALALRNGDGRVITYDPVARPERAAYLHLGGRSTLARIELRDEPDINGPHADDAPVELLFIDSSHDRESVVGAFRTWRLALAPGAIVVFHDYGHPAYPGVRDGVSELELNGRQRGSLFVWCAQA
jgi:SAM-dependent methyltransferase